MKQFRAWVCVCFGNVIGAWKSLDGVLGGQIVRYRVLAMRFVAMGQMCLYVAAFTVLVSSS